MLNLPDRDVFTLDAFANPPVALDGPTDVFRARWHDALQYGGQSRLGQKSTSRTRTPIISNASPSGKIHRAHGDRKVNFNRITIISGQ